MTVIRRNTDLNGNGRSDSFSNGWETSVARAFDVVVYTGNLFAAYSVDGGDNFQAMDVYGLHKAHGQNPCCDQVVIYIPSITQFAWVGLTQEGNILLALASPNEIRDGQGRFWTSWLIPANQFGDGRSTFDQPTVAVGDNFLYITCNLGRVAIALRLSIIELYARGLIHLPYFIAPDVFWLRPALNTGQIGYFAALLGSTDSEIRDIRVFSWPERSNTWAMFDIGIQQVPRQEGTITTPNGTWISTEGGNPHAGGLQVLGLTLTGPQLWAAWVGYRTITGQTRRTFPYPHIAIAIINVQTRRLEAQRYLWNPDFAFTWPALATNAQGDIGLSFCWGGEKNAPQYGVGMLTGRDQRLFSVTADPNSTAAGGDYTTIRPSFPDVYTFCAAGFNQLLPGPVNHPRFLLFEP
jgi:hypothetical protein